MLEDTKYYLVTKEAVPEVLLKVVEAKRFLETEKTMTVQRAIDLVGISRSSFYKYKDSIVPFHDNTRGTVITFVLEMADRPGLLSVVLNLVARYNANILTIHQSIPMYEVALLTLSVDMLKSTGDASLMLKELEELEGIYYLKILSKE